MSTPITWHALQDKLRECKTESQVEKLIAAELGTDAQPGPRRKRWLVRMWGRLRALRTERENAEILAKVGE